MRAGSPDSPALRLRPRCQSNPDAVCFYRFLSLSAQFTGTRERELEGEGARRREECGAQVMAEGAKMVGASRGRAQQRALAQEGEKETEEKAARVLKRLTRRFNAEQKTHWSAFTADEMMNCFQSYRAIGGSR